VSSCITIIDTVIQTNNTNDAYISDTYTAGIEQQQAHAKEADNIDKKGAQAEAQATTNKAAKSTAETAAAKAEAVAEQVYIGVFSVVSQYNCVYYCDTLHNTNTTTNTTDTITVAQGRILVAAAARKAKVEGAPKKSGMLFGLFG
jgi:hypothetical protein